MNDKATLDNKTDRSRDSQDRSSASTSGRFGSPAGMANSRPSSIGNLNSAASTKGAGKIDRSEEIKLSVAAVVTDVLPNGNL